MVQKLKYSISDRNRMGFTPPSFPKFIRETPVLTLHLQDEQIGVFLFNQQLFGYKWIKNTLNVVVNPNPLRFQGEYLFQITMQLDETVKVVVMSNQIQYTFTLWNHKNEPIFLQSPQYPPKHTEKIGDEIPLYTRCISPPPLSRTIGVDTGLWNPDKNLISRFFPS